MEKIKWLEKVTNAVLGRIEEDRTLLNNIPHRKANFIGSNLRSSFFLHMSLKGR